MSKITFEHLTGIADAHSIDSGLLESFYFSCRVKNLTESSVKCYAERIWYLMKYAALIGKALEDITTKDLQDYVMSLMNRVSPATVNGRIIVYKVFYKHLFEEGLIGENPTTRLKKVKAPIKVKPVLTPEQMGSVLSKLNRKTFHGSRDHCMILLTFDSMLRLNELLTIRLKDIDLKSKLVKVYGKGRKERYAPFSASTAKSIHTYLVRHRKQTPGTLLFTTTDGRKIDYRRAHRIFANPGKKAGLHVHPHLVRHSAATWFAKSGGNISILQKILGHSSLQVTQRYVHLSNEDMTEAYERHSPAAALR